MKGVRATEATDTERIVVANIASLPNIRQAITYVKIT